MTTSPPRSRAPRARIVGGHSYTAQPVEANLDPHCFMFPANLYYNQIGPFAGGGVMRAVFWPDFDAAPPGDNPVRSVEDGYRQVSIELRYVGGAGAADYLAQDLTGRVALTPRWGSGRLAATGSDPAGAEEGLRGVVQRWISSWPSAIMSASLICDQSKQAILETRSLRGR